MARKGFGGMDLTSPLNRISGKVALCVNLRGYWSAAVTLRSLLTDAILTVSNAIQTIARLNDSTPSGPAGGFTYILKDAAGNLYNGVTGTLSPIVSGLSANPVSIVTFRPNASVEPWGYIADTSQSVTLPSSTGASVTPPSTGSSTTWTNPTNATSTTLFATYTGGPINGINMNVSGLTIPTNATILGIGVTFKISISASSVLIFLSPNFVGVTTVSLPVSTVPTVYSAGGSGSLWGLSLTPAMLNAGFSFGFSSRSTANTVSLNSFTITIYYSVPASFISTGMLKVRSDGLVRKMGIKEPQQPPIVGINTLTSTQWLTLPGNTPPWTNISGVNSNYNYSGTDTEPPFPSIIATPVPGSTVTLTVTGSAVVNGISHNPGDSGPTAANFPGNFIAAAVIVVFAFTDALGNIIAKASAGGSPPVVGNVGAGATLTVPVGAAQLQIGINSQGGTFSANTGSYLVQAVVSTSSITQVASIVGLITAYVFGDSPHSGPVGSYIWKNPADFGTGIAKTIGSASAVATNNSLIFDSSPEDGTVPVLWTTLDSTGTSIGSIDLFSPALESEGYQDFNACIVGSIFVPAGGTYAIQFQYKDQIMVGIGGGATSTGGTIFGFSGQTETVVKALPLLFVSTVDGAGGNHTTSINVTFPAVGIYPIEIDWDYWFHTGRSLIVQMAPTPGGGVATIPPLPQGVRTNVQYWGKYRAAETGALSNPGPASPNQQTPVLANTILMPFSPDPQVSKWDCYRQDDGLPNPTYVATGPNDGLGGTINGVLYNTAIEDTLSDIAAAANQIMQRDDFEPVPSIDTPKSGFVTIVAGVVTWKSGDQFNLNWLPGTLMLIGAPTQNAFTLIARPISTTQIVIPDIPDTIGDAAGDGVPYNIAEPILGNQPLPYVFGPTDNINFALGVGDPYRPGTLYWSKGSNLDSWPDTNQMDVTDPSEPLVNGCMSGGRGVLASIKRFWVIMPNFFNAQATATGTSGSTWTLQASSITRDLFIPRCLAVSGGGTIFFRVDDGIHVSPGGLGSESITDGDLYPLFSHEGSVPQAITRNGVTIYPPDDSQPQKQQFSYQNGFLYYDYWGIDSAYHTLVFDESAGGWIYDIYAQQVVTHAPNEGASTQGILAGCADHTLRSMTPSGTEAGVLGKVLTPAIGGKGFIFLQEVTIEYSSNDAITLSTLAADTNNGSYGPADVMLPSTGGIIAKTKFIVGPCKGKLFWFQFASSDPTFKVYTDGFAVRMKDWGSRDPWRQVNPLADINPYFPQRGGFGTEA